MMKMKIIAWFSRDSFSPFCVGMKHVVTLFGCDEKGVTCASSVVVHLEFKISVPCGADMDIMVDFLREYVFDVRVEKVLGKSFQGFSEEESVFLQLSFTTLKGFQRCKRLFRNQELHPRVLAELPTWFVSQRFDWCTFESDIPPLCHAMLACENNIPVFLVQSVSWRRTNFLLEKPEM
jgi:hypothetical protein